MWLLKQIQMAILLFQNDQLISETIKKETYNKCSFLAFCIFTIGTMHKIHTVKEEKRKTQGSNRILFYCHKIMTKTQLAIEEGCVWKRI